MGTQCTFPVSAFRCHATYVVCVLVQSQALLGKKHMEAVHIKSSLNDYLAEFSEVSTLTKEQYKQLQVLCFIL